MVTVDITIDPKDEGNEEAIRRKVLRAIRAKSMKAENIGMTLVKRSIDARHGRVRIFLRYEADLKANGNLGSAAPPSSDGLANDEAKASQTLLRKGLTSLKGSQTLLRKGLTGGQMLQGGSLSVVIVGTGPAGLFAALTLLRHGIKPILIERGKRTKERKKDIAAISRLGVVDSDSNYCFGEGGAGTFSDGKLYTRSGKRGNMGALLRELVEAGADERILTDSRPHIGTDRLPKVVTVVTDKIISLGGECRFNTRCTNLVIEGGCVRGIETEDTRTGERNEVRGDAVLLATGHGATDIYTMLHKAAPHSLAAKGFAVGVRVEHPRELIDSIQYHGRKGMGAAEYRLTAQAAGTGGVRGVYSFCMCPGGFVVPSSTGQGECVVNGMSASGRNSKWSNSAIVMEVRVGDEALLPLPQPLADIKAPLSLLDWRASLEREAYCRGEKQRAPAQRLQDFLARRDSLSLPPSSYTPGTSPSRLDEWLPKLLVERLTAAFRIFDSKMKGFITEDALLIAGETRTSSPVRILRDAKTLECPSLHGLYAAGEGSGFAGGIVSSAFDGERAAEAIAKALTA